MDAAMIAAAIVVYLLFNIIGTYYFTTLKSSGGEKGIAMSTVLFGWFFFPPANITSPIMVAYGG